MLPRQRQICHQLFQPTVFPFEVPNACGIILRHPAIVGLPAVHGGPRHARLPGDLTTADARLHFGQDVQNLVFAVGLGVHGPSPDGLILSPSGWAELRGSGQRSVLPGSRPGCRCLYCGFSWLARPARRWCTARRRGLGRDRLRAHPVSPRAVPRRPAPSRPRPPWRWARSAHAAPCPGGWSLRCRCGVAPRLGAACLKGHARRCSPAGRGGGP